MSVRKTTVAVDEELAARAGRILGTATLTATVNQSMREVLAAAARRRMVSRLGRMDGLELALTDQADFDRVVEVMSRLSRSGHHRALSIPDLLIAAVAERAGLIVVHYDQDFDHISRITHQPMQWVAPKGSLQL